MCITVLDGGLGTTLENDANGSALWSAACVQNAPDRLVEVHQGFLGAGARIIETATYQVAHVTGARAGLDRQQTEQIMCSAVRLADMARNSFYDCGDGVTLDELNNRGTSPTGAGRHISQSSAEVEVALSLGPYGATLVPSCEFSGIYPPPYGPPEDEAAAEDALASWHLERLRVYARHDDIWAKINIAAFETIPLLREIRAVRRAMRTLLDEQNSPAAEDSYPVTGAPGSPGRLTSTHKNWWISCTFPGPDARFPDATVSTGAAATEIVRAVLGDSDGLAIPTGIGINCTPAAFLPRLTQELCNALRHHVLHSPVGASDPLISSDFTQRRLEERYLPWIVLYPNGGKYSEERACWMANDTPAWSAALAEAVGIVDAEFGSHACRTRSSASSLDCHSTRISRVIVGGCCNTGPLDINALTQTFHLEWASGVQEGPPVYVPLPGNAL